MVGTGLTHPRGIDASSIEASHLTISFPSSAPSPMRCLHFRSSNTSSPSPDLIPRFFTASTIYPSISRCCWSASYRRPVRRLRFHHASGSLLSRLLSLVTALLKLYTRARNSFDALPRSCWPFHVQFQFYHIIRWHGIRYLRDRED